MFNCPSCENIMVQKNEPIVNVQQEKHPDIPKLKARLDELRKVEETEETQEELREVALRLTKLEAAVYPYKIVSVVSNVYTCDKCRITLVKTNTEDYYPTVME